VLRQNEKPVATSSEAPASSALRELIHITSENPFVILLLH